MLTKSNTSNTTVNSIFQNLRGYQGNDKILMAGQKYQYTQQEIAEFVKCSQDIHYFVENYMKIVHVDHGLVPFNLYGYQKKLIDVLVKERYIIGKLPRQVGKSSVTVAYLLWYVLFTPNVKVVILAHRAKTARELFGKVRLAYENLPKFLQAGIAPGGWNKSSIHLGNGSSIHADATSSGSIRGESFNCVAGKENITLRIDRKEFTISLERLFDIAKSSIKSNINNRDEITLESLDAELFIKQIHKLVFSYNSEQIGQSFRKNTISDRISPYHSEMYGRNRYSREFDIVESERTFNSSSFTTQNGSPEAKKDIAYMCASSNDQWQTGSIIETFRRKEENIHEKLVGSKFINEKRISTFRANQKTNKRNLEEENLGRSSGDRPGVWISTYRGDQKENFRSSQREDTIRRGQTEDFSKEHWNTSREEKTARIRSKNFGSIERSYEISGTCEQNKPESRKNKKNSGKTSRNEKIRGIQEKNVRSSQGKNSLEQRIEIKTIKGWKHFKGIKRTCNQPTIKLEFSNNVTVECTKDHLFETNTGWIKAKDIANIDGVLTENGFKKLVNIDESIHQDVFDILEVEKCNSFLVNGISVHNCVVLDEFAFVPKNLADEFMESVFPTISSGQTTKLIIMSTPKGMNKFYDIWKGANETDPEKKNSFVPVEIKWNEPPGRDDAWKAEQIALIGPRKWRQEYEANFVGTSSTLIDGDHLEKMMANVKKPITIHNGFRIYEAPKPGYKYSICVDVSRGLGLDYHAFTVVDVTNLPYRLVAVFQDNEMYPTILPNVIADTAKKYNNAHILVEISDIGQQVADMLIGDLDCDNVIRIMSRPGVGQVIGFGFAGKVQNGLKTSNATKKVGAMDLKTLIESGNLIIEDDATVNEFLTFVANSTGTYSAEAGYHDDLVMTFVLFGWLSHQRYFREEAHDIREIIQRQQEEYLDSQLTPFGIFDDGVEQIHYDYGDNTFGNF